jgi:hypothetical protein
VRVAKVPAIRLTSGLCEGDGESSVRSSLRALAKQSSGEGAGEANEQLGMSNDVDLGVASRLGSRHCEPDRAKQSSGEGGQARYPGRWLWCEFHVSAEESSLRAR